MCVYNLGAADKAKYESILASLQDKPIARAFSDTDRYYRQTKPHQRIVLIVIYNTPVPILPVACRWCGLYQSECNCIIIVFNTTAWRYTFYGSTATISRLWAAFYIKQGNTHDYTYRHIIALTYKYTHFYQRTILYCDMQLQAIFRSWAYSIKIKYYNKNFTTCNT